ncbi:MAG: hypothetical protein K1X74_13840 [Pirellulales bacterium]|nr:hypothetical protein [Pirellulales bacterium]
MKLGFAFVARGAEAHEGRLHVFSGDFDTIEIAQFPTTIGPISLVIKVCMEPEECNLPHILQVRLQDPSGGAYPVGQPIQLVATPNVLMPRRQAGVNVILDTTLACQVEGEHVYLFYVDGKQIGELPLYVRHSTELR